MVEIEKKTYVDGNIQNWFNNKLKEEERRTTKNYLEDEKVVLGKP